MKPTRILKAQLVAERARPLEVQRAIEGFGGLPPGPLAELYEFCEQEKRSNSFLGENAAGRREALAGVQIKLIAIVRRG